MGTSRLPARTPRGPLLEGVPAPQSGSVHFLVLSEDGVKRLLGRLLFGRERIPQYVAVGLGDPQEQISVFLHGMGQALDVTSNNVAASLRPFRIAICLPAEPCEELLRRARLFLSFGERHGARAVMGTIRLRFD